MNYMNLLSVIMKPSVHLHSSIAWKYIFILILQEIYPILWTDAQETLGYAIVAGKTYQYQEVVLG